VLADDNRVLPGGLPPVMALSEQTALPEQGGDRPHGTAVPDAVWRPVVFITGSCPELTSLTLVVAAGKTIGHRT